MKIESKDVMQYKTALPLKDQSWVLVTGASSGFGEEFARQYAAQGRPLVEFPRFSGHSA